MDGGLEIEIALRNAVTNQKDFFRFADTARAVARELGLNDNDRDRIYKALAESIVQWENLGT
ncbi:MAG: hypothetical protein K2Y18_03985 [Alphaproteobacteria bacterium]|jgi:hypothetical protein|nr:hypothetical protein [Alphaproteobacteria bacterium]